MKPDALILCGGSATRLAGIDKPLRVFAGRPLIAQILERIAPQVGTIVLSVNRSREDYVAYGHALVDDGDDVGFGPLAGIAAGLAQAGSTDMLCVPGDAPWLPLDLAARLSLAQKKASAQIAFVHDGIGPQPLCCLLPRALLDNLRLYLERGGRTPREWFARHNAVSVDFSDWPRWAWSLNTEEEWRAAERNLAAIKLAQ